MLCCVVLCCRARLLFAECLDRMAFKGPDIAFVLYSYAIFGEPTLH